MLNRRAFLGSIALPSAAVMAGVRRPARASDGAFNLDHWLGTLEDFAGVEGSPEDIAQDESYWQAVQQAFTPDRTIINLNNGGVSPAPRVVQEAMKRHLDISNSEPAYYLWRVQEPSKEVIRERVARHWGVAAEEIAFTRNASESLQICQLGVDLKPGDEVLTTTQDYPRMLTTFKQRERRDGITLVQIKIPVPCEDDDEIVRRFEAGITPKTRMILMSHIINITGQILPVKRVVQMARGKNGGIPVVIDGAHALAHFKFQISDLNCDYYGVSLHKWLFAPHGTGLLYVRKDQIKGLWPMMAASAEQDDNIRKFEEIGTHPAANVLAIADALAFHQAIGDERKEARMRYLRHCWQSRLEAASRGIAVKYPAVFLTPMSPAHSCGICTVRLEGLECAKVAEHLWEKRRIHVTPIKADDMEGIRVTPSVYTTLGEIDLFCELMEHLIASGLPEVKK